MRWADTGQAKAGIRAEFKLPVDRTLKEQRENLESKKQDTSMEWQAYEFAARLLVPPDALREAFRTAIQTDEAAGYADWLAADEAALDYIATRTAPKFGVSAEVIAKGLRLEKLWADDRFLTMDEHGIQRKDAR